MALRKHQLDAIADDEPFVKDCLRRKSPQLDELTKKRPPSFVFQVQEKSRKLAQERQVLNDVARLDALPTRTPEETLQLDTLVRELGFFVDSADSYEPSNHEPQHAAWKQAMNAVFTELVSDFTISGDNVLYLDDLEAHTTTALRSRFGNSRTLFVANWNDKTRASLKSSDNIDEVEQCALADLLVKKWRNKLFAAAYLDLCSKSASSICEALRNLLRSKNQCKIVGFTMTQRDSEDYNQVERLDRVESELRRLCPKMYRVTDLQKFKDVLWTDNGVVTRFYLVG
jgi:hypothetical protein